MSLIFLYYKGFSGNMETYFEHLMVPGITPAFYKSSEKASKSRIIRCCSRILHKYGVVINSVILHLMTLAIYSSIGAILRHTMFHYNIKKDYGIYEDHINATMKPNRTERNKDMQSYVDQILFDPKKLESEKLSFSFSIRKSDPNARASAHGFAELGRHSTNKMTMFVRFVETYFAI